jgi:1-acyl-sn-glycerol-3-phosphate acyltransferase
MAMANRLRIPRVVKMNSVHSSEVSDSWIAKLVRKGFIGWYHTIGWRFDGDVVLPKKVLIVAAPHTSNWDFPFALAVGAYYRLKVNFIGKDSMFRWPFGGLIRWLGGIPVDRSQRKDAVGAMVAAFAARTEMHLIIAPEGTRSAVDQWKSGFYHIAVGAGVPIAFAYLDYPTKRGGIAELFYPTGNYDTDIQHIRGFYKNIIPRYPHKTKIA